MFSETTRETLTEDINIAINQGELLQNSAHFLLTKLQDLSSSEGKFTSEEIKIIEKQLDYHKQMYAFKSSFDIKKLLMRSKLKQSISWLLNQMQWKSITDTDLLDLECKLEQWLFNDSRDVIDDKLNNNDTSIEWFTDWFLNHKIIWEFEKTNNILNYFTLELLENNILVDETRANYEWQKFYSELSEIELNKHVTNTIQILLSKNLSFPDNIELSHWDEIVSVDLVKIKTELIAEENLRLEEIERQRLKEERESNKIYLLWLLESQLNNTINTEWKEVLERKFKFTWNIDDWENEWYINLLNHYISEWYIDKQYIVDLYKKNKISKIILLNFLEQDENFNYVEFIEEYWLTKKIKDIVLKYSREKLSIADNIEDKVLIENLTLFLLTFIMIESSWYNVKNRAWASTADWFYQFLNANGKEKNWVWLTGSFQTALNRLNSLSPKEDENWIMKENFLDIWFFESRFWKFYVPDNPELEKIKRPSDLSSENQTILFFLDIVENWKEISKDIYSDDMMKLILSERNSWALWRIYMLLHHTDPDKETIDVYEREKNKYYYWDKKYIAKHHY